MTHDNNVKNADMRYARAMGAELKKLRAQRGWNVLQLAGILGIGRSTLSSYEQGARLISVALLRRISTVLGSRASYVLTAVEYVIYATEELPGVTVAVDLRDLATTQEISLLPVREWARLRLAAGHTPVSLWPMYAVAALADVCGVAGVPDMLTVLGDAQGTSGVDE